MIPETELKTLSHAELRARANLKTGTVKTGHAGFDRMANHPSYGYVGTGNVISGVQVSGFVRPRTVTECNGLSFAEGRLRDIDLRLFSTVLSRAHMGIVLKATEEREAILYLWIHMSGRGLSERTFHGWTLTDRFYQLHTMAVTGPTGKSTGVVTEMTKYVAWET